jgi:hypothetical protein
MVIADVEEIVPAILERGKEITDPDGEDAVIAKL